MPQDNYDPTVDPWYHGTAEGINHENGDTCKPADVPASPEAQAVADEIADEIRREVCSNT